jgi:hypothetical protein
MSILFSVLALTGNKGAALQSARDDFTGAAIMAIAHGNKRNLEDTATRMRKDGGVTKGGEYAKNKKGEILAAFVAACDMTTSARSAFLAAYPGHKGKPSAAMMGQATRQACTVADEFEQAVALVLTPKKKTAPVAQEGTAQAQEGTATAPEAPQAEEGTATAPEATPDEFAVFMGDAVKALGRDKIKALILAAMTEQAQEAEQAPAPAKKRRAA